MGRIARKLLVKSERSKRGGIDLSPIKMTREEMQKLRDAEQG